MKLQGKIAIVTGGGTGIGSGIACALAEEGAQVIVAGRREEKLKEVAGAYSGSIAIDTHTVDVTCRDSVKTLIDDITKKYGKVDILVNNAGANIAKRKIAEVSDEDWDFLMKVNVTGAFYTMTAVLPQMRDRKDGVIINVSSIAGKRASLLGGVAYSASKFAMTALGSTVGLEERVNGIRITNIYPGEVATPILEQRTEPVSDERKAAMLQPEDLGAAAAMVACLHPRAHVPELIMKPLVQDYC